MIWSKYTSTLSGTSVRGSYSTTQFVLRLRDDVKRAMNSKDNSFEKVQAFSTFLHETIHWWQNIGSNYGFLNSLTFPTIGLLGFGQLKKFKSLGILSKPLTKFDQINLSNSGINDLGPLNLILNNYYDLNYAKLFGFDNNAIFEIVKDKRFFISIGHSYSMLWGNNISTLKFFDKNNNFLPNIEEWQEPFRKMQNKGLEGFGIDAKLRISKLGIHAIFEGQAIFNQLQYLSSCLDDKLTIKECKNRGKLFGIYLKAFNRFFELTGLDKPIFISDSIIGLFLLVCDIAINPTNGFPMDIHNFEEFIYLNDPGIRFEIICDSIKANKKLYQNCITNYSEEEYKEVSNMICRDAKIGSPMDSCKKINSWFENPNIKKLLNDEANSDYSLINLPVQILFSKFLRFQEDKLKTPHVFCWVGYHMSNVNNKEQYRIISSLFEKHKALFVEGNDGEVKPAIFDHLDENKTQIAFNNFYQSTLMYEIILQWIQDDGDFDLTFNWLTNDSDTKVKPFITNQFENIFGFKMDEITY